MDQIQMTNKKPDTQDSQPDIDKDSVIIEIEEAVLSQQALVENLMSISVGVQIFLLNVINAAKQHGTYKLSYPATSNSSSDKPEPNSNKLITRKRLQNFIAVNIGERNVRGGVSDALISKRLGELFNLQVCTSKVYSGVAAREKYYHHKITDLSKLAGLPPVREKKKEPAKRRTQSQVMVQREYFMKDDSAIFLHGHKELSVHIHQQIFNGILDSAMRLSHKDQRKEIEVTYSVMGNPLIINATCSTSEDSGIAILTDQRAMRPIIAYCKKEIARRKAILVAEHGSNYLPSMIPNVFKLDISDLCELMSMKPQSVNIELAVAMMRRLADTNFKVDASQNEWFRENFSMMPGSDGGMSDIFEFKFLQNLEITKDLAKAADLFNTDPSVLRPKFYTFSLEIRLFYSLVVDNSSTIFISHQDLSAELSGIIQRFYNWARFWVSGRERPNLTKKWYSLADMHAKLTPAARMDNFRTYFLRALAKKAIGEFKVGGTGKALVYGYYVFYKQEHGVDYFRFERDRNDPIVGDNSKHNVQIRQGLLEHTGGTVIEAELD